MATALGDLADEQFCYVTTTGRRTGRPHEIEIWFGARDHTVYMLSGGRERSDWVRNIIANPQVAVRVGERHFGGAGRVVKAETDEDRTARRLLLEKYSATYSGDLTEWGATALPVAIDVSEIPPG
jgi:deazaflavin-dependent oxidoreductase (nitroreductase family)